MVSILLVTACAAKSKNTGAATPKEAVTQALESARQLDLKTFNAYTDNYIGMKWDFIGFPVEKEYKVFGELLQPYIIKRKRYEEKRRFAEKVVENLAWEIGEIQEEEDGAKAKIHLTLTNKDMSEAVERYVMWITEDTIHDIEYLSGAFSVSGLVDMVSGIVNECDDDLIRFMDETDSICTMDVIVTAYKDNDGWKIYLTDEFINAFMGNIETIETEGYSERLEK